MDFSKMSKHNLLDKCKDLNIPDKDSKGKLFYEILNF